MALTSNLVIGYALCSTLLAQINRFTLSKFNYPGVLTALQCLTSAVGVWVLGKVGFIHHDPFTLEKGRRFLPAALVFYLAIFTNTNLLRHADVGIFTFLTPLLVAIADSFRKQPCPSKLTFLASLIIFISAVGLAATDNGLSFTAYSWALAYLVTIATEILYIKDMVTNFRLNNVWGFVFYTNILALTIAPLFWFLTGEYADVFASIASSADLFEPFSAVSISCVFGLLLTLAGGVLYQQWEPRQMDTEVLPLLPPQLPPQVSPQVPPQVSPQLFHQPGSPRPIVYKMRRVVTPVSNAVQTAANALRSIGRSTATQAAANASQVVTAAATATTAATAVATAVVLSGESNSPDLPLPAAADLAAAYLGLPILLSALGASMLYFVTGPAPRRGAAGEVGRVSASVIGGILLFTYLKKGNAEVLPMDYYEPPLFRGCAEYEAHNPWTRNPLKMDFGIELNCKHLVLAPKMGNLSSIFNIRGLFPDKSVPALGVYHGIQEKYLKTLLFCVCEAVDGPMIEEYSFSFSYSNSDSQDVSMNINRSGTKKGGTFKYNSSTEITPSQMRTRACKMVGKLIQLMRTLEKMPEERTVLMKLLYYDDVTPMDYEPPFFRGCTEDEAQNPWTRNPLKMEVGKVNSKHLVLALKVKSVLDPCEDENNDNQDDEISLGADSHEKNDDSDSDSEMSNSDDDQYMVAPREKQQVEEENGANDEDANTQDLEEDEQQLGRIKDWINSYHLDTVELTDILSNFPDISVVLIEEIMDKLEKEMIISKSSGESYVITKKKKFDYEFDAVKEEVEGHFVLDDGKAGNTGADHMYMKALYHTLPLEYITVVKLQNKLDGKPSQATVRKLIEKMAHDGFVEAGSNNRRLGKRVIHSDLSKKKLLQLKRLFTSDAMDVDKNESVNKSNLLELDSAAGNVYKDLSTCGGLHSIGSDITRTKGRSDGKKMERGGNTPTSRAEIQPAASRESFVPGGDKGRANLNGDQGDVVMESVPTQSQDKHLRKTSTVKEPIQQFSKRQKSQPL